MLRPILLVALLFSLAAAPTTAQDADLPADRARAAVDHLQVRLASKGLLPTDVADLLVADGHVSASGITYAYVRQRLNGIEIAGAQVTVAMNRQGDVFHTAGDLRAGTASEVVSRTAGIGATDALLAASRLVGADLTAPAVSEAKGDASRETRFQESPKATGEPKARLVYWPIVDGSLRLAWEVTLWPRGGNLWRVVVDATTGSELARMNLTVHDHWGPSEPAEPESFAPLAALLSVESSTMMPRAESHARVAGYRVFATPDETPLHGLMARTLLADPSDATASPFGWHDTDGVTGAEFTITRGNNTHTYIDRDDDEMPDVAYPEPDGTASLTFDFPLDFADEPNLYTDASATNLFYWTNFIHDVLYQYGFTEAAGNFQVNNYGNGGADDDAVDAEVQSGADGVCTKPYPCHNNANFSTPEDGDRPRMQMFDGTGGVPARDGAFDAAVIGHEFAHGLSNRLVGGPSNIACLGNDEQMGEGWSDFYGLMLTMQPGSTRTTSRGMGIYLFYQSASGLGIRPAPYNTDLAVNGFTYGDTQTALTIPHEVGFVWATALWEATWDLMDAHGFSADLYNANGTAGNQIMLRLVTEAMKLTPCSPGFVDARNAILAADAALYPDLATPGQGLHYATLWGAFARRGLGASASQGLTSTNADNIEAFDLPLPPGALTYAPSALSLMLEPDSTGTRTVALQNTAPAGHDDLDWSAAIANATLPAGSSPPATWVSISLMSGTVAPGASGSFSVDFDATSLTEGSYSADLVITSNDPGNSTLVIPISLSVTGGATVTGSAGWRLLSAAAPGITVGEIAALNLVQGVPGLYPPPEATPNVFTAFDGSAYSAATGVAEVLTPGQGFWWYLFDIDLAPGAASNSFALPMTLTTERAPTTMDVPVALHGNGWNMLGNPFATSLDVTGIVSWPGSGALASSVTHVWDASINNFRNSLSTPTIASWQGFFVEAASTGTLTIPETARTTGGVLTRAAEPDPMIAFELSAVGRDEKDVAAILRFSKDALVGRDLLSASKLIPVSESFVTIGFGDAAGNMLSVDSRPLNTLSFSVPVHISSTDAGAALELRWPTMSGIPEAWTVSLEDLQTGASVDLRATGSVAITVEPSASRPTGAEPAARTMKSAAAARFRLTVTTGSVVATEDGAASAFSLDAPRPNPASSQTRIGFALAEAGAMRLTVVDIQGREVAVLLDEDRPVGPGLATFDASNLAAGVYVARLDAGGAMLARRLVVAR